MFIFLDVNYFIKDVQRELYDDIEEIVLIFFKISFEKYFRAIYPFLLMQLDLGAKVRIYLDGVFSATYFEGFTKSLFVNKERLEKNRKKLVITQKALNELKNKGALVNYFNPYDGSFIYKIFPFIKRDHRKFIYVKKKNKSNLTYFGATNLSSANSYDYMIKCTNYDLNEKLLEKNIYVWQHPFNTPNQLIDISPYGSNSEIIIDTGTKFSLIYQKAVKLVQAAKKEIVFVSQLPVEPHLLFYLVAARLRGVNVKVLMPNINHPKMKWWYIKLTYSFARLIGTLFSINIKFVKTNYTHAKILMCDGNICVLGSHNLSWFGVMCKTLEMSIISSDSDLISSTQAFLSKLE